MSELPIEAYVAPHEAALVYRAADLLAEALGAVSGQAWRVPVDRREGLPGGPLAAPVGLLSPHQLLPVREPGPKLRTAIEAAQSGGGLLLVLTLFRALPPGDRRLPWVRRLNHLAITLSQQVGSGVVDLDAALAARGGLALGSDLDRYGSAGVQVGAAAIARAIARSGLDRSIAPEVAEAAAERIRTAR